MNDAKLTLSPEELALVQDADIILTKNAIIEKVYALFGQLAPAMEEALRPLAGEMEDVMSVPAKISRGESYLDLPYVILDYPRYFRPHDIFAIRTMFWWGHFFSLTLHLKGNYREHFHRQLIRGLPEFSRLQFFASIGTDEWEHHFGEDNYIQAALIEPDEWETLYNARSFSKLALQFPLSGWNVAEGAILDGYKQIVRLLVGA